MAVLSVACSESHSNVREIYPAVVTSATEGYRAIADIEEVVQLQEVEHARVGAFDIVKVDPKTGDIYVADATFTNSIYRFSRDGTYRSKVASTPGSTTYRQLSDFAVFENQDIALVADSKLAVVNHSGPPNSELQVPYLPFRVVAERDRLYVQAVIFSPQPDHEHSVFVYDHSLRPITSFHSFDRRLTQLMYLSRSSLVSIDNTIYVADFYDLRVTAYNAEGTALFAYVLDSYNDDIAPLWEKRPFDTSVKAEIRRRIHHFLTVLPFNQQLFYIEQNTSRGIFQAAIIDLRTQTTYKFPGANLLKTTPPTPGFRLDAIVGSYENGILGTLYDPEVFATLKKDTQVASEITLEEGDYPLLLFLRVKIPQ